MKDIEIIRIGVNKQDDAYTVTEIGKKPRHWLVLDTYGVIKVICEILRDWEYQIPVDED